MSNPVLTRIRETWDTGDPWASCLLALGAACDLHTVLGNEQAGYVIPASVGYRHPMLSHGAYGSLLTERESDDGSPFPGAGEEAVYVFDDPITGEIADALGLEPCEDAGPCLAASIPAWAAQGRDLLLAIRVLDRLADQYRLAGLDY